MHAGAAVADIGAVDHRRAVRLAGHAHRPRGRLRHRLEAFVVAVRAIGPEPLDRGIDDARIEFLDRVVAEPEPLHDPGAEVLGDDIGLSDHAAGDFLPFVGLQIDDRAALVAVEQQEEKAVDIRVIHVPQPARPVAERRPLDLDHIGPEPRQHLRTGRPGLIVREVDNPNAFKRFGHWILLSYWRPVRGTNPRQGSGRAYRGIPSARTAPPRLRGISVSRARLLAGEDVKSRQPFLGIAPQRRRQLVLDLRPGIDDRAHPIGPRIARRRMGQLEKMEQDATNLAAHGIAARFCPNPRSPRRGARGRNGCRACASCAGPAPGTASRRRNRPRNAVHPASRYSYKCNRR